jgi:hypothetical protein
MLPLPLVAQQILRKLLLLLAVRLTPLRRAALPRKSLPKLNKNDPPAAFGG